MTTYAAEAAEETQSVETSVEDQAPAAETDADQQEDSEQEEEIDTAAEPVEEAEEVEDQAENSDADVVEEVSEDLDEDEDSESGNKEEASEEGGTQQDAAAAIEEIIESEEGKEAAQGVTAIALNETEIELKTDETFQLTATVNTKEGEAGAVQDDTIEWSSDNSRIAQVDDNGLVTAKKQGNTSINASVEGYDEEGDYYQYSAVCTVNVTTAMEGTCGDNLTWKIDETSADPGCVSIEGNTIKALANLCNRKELPCQPAMFVFDTVRSRKAGSAYAVPEPTDPDTSLRATTPGSQRWPWILSRKSPCAASTLAA
jgi:hypothetical protein